MIRPSCYQVGSFVPAMVWNVTEVRLGTDPGRIFISPDIREGALAAEDSSLFANFRQRMHGEAVLEKAPHPLEEYKLVWAEAREGHAYNLLRGDGSALTGYLSDGHLPRPHYHRGLGPVFYGDRFATVGDSPDTGLVRYEYWYYERVVPAIIKRK